MAAVKVALAFVVLTGWAAFPSADLVIVELTIAPPAPLPGARVELTATVENVGDLDAEDQFLVRFEANERLIQDPAVSGGLRAGKRKAVTASWVAEAGVHFITAEADQPFDRILESDEENNTASLEVAVPSPAEIASRLAGLRIAVGPFEDRSNSGLVNAGSGIADALSERLAETGVRVIAAAEVEDALQQRGLSPYVLGDVEAAAEGLGADVLVVGSIAGVHTLESTLSLGLVTLGGGSAEVSVEATALDIPEIESLTEISAAGHFEGTTELSLDLGTLLSRSGASGICVGGLETDRDVYYGGDLISIGYTNPGPASWYSAEIYTSTGTFVRWLGWQYTATGGCGHWFWDQRNSFDAQVPASVYIIKIWDGASHVASTTFQIRPGVSLFPLVDEITVGSESFEDSIVGEAMARAVDELVAGLVASLEGVSPHRTQAAGQPSFASAPSNPSAEGQVAAILPDGRIAITLGASAGVAEGDRYEVLSQTSDARGEIVIVDVRNDVSYALQTAGDEPTVGDSVRAIMP